MKIVTAHNPSFLQLVGANPARKRRTTAMAVTRRAVTRTSPRRAPVARANPRRRKRSNFSLAPRRRSRRRSTAIARRNPARFTRRHRRNPSAIGGFKGLFTGAVFVAGGAIATQYGAGFIPVTRFGPWGVLAVKAGVAYGVGIVAHKLGVSPANASLMTLGGLAGVAQDAFGLIRSKFPDVLQASAVQVGTTGAPASVTGSPSSADMYGTSPGVADIAMFQRGGGMWGRGSGMGDVVMFGRA